MIPYLNRGGGKIMPTLFWCPHQVLKATGTPGHINRHARQPKCQNPRSNKQPINQFHIQFHKIIGPIMFWGGERSQRGKEKDGCDHPLTEAISYRHIT